MSIKKIRPRRLWKQTAAAALSLSLLLPAAVPVWAADAKPDPNAERVKEVMELLQKTHVSAPSASKLSEASIQAMLETLKDPYTDYFTPEDLAQFQDSVENQYVGIGVRVVDDPEGVYIAEVFDGSPAKDAGIKSADLIVGVHGERTVGQKMTAVISQIMGPENTSVDIEILRDSEYRSLSVKRKKVQIPTVVRKSFKPGIGYIQVTSFSSDADEQTDKDLAALKDEGIQSLIVDLRDNGGGYLDTALQLAKLFVKQGILIHTRDRDNLDVPVEITGGTAQQFPVYFLVNENSASASEVLTGALQDYGVITVIGTKTFGKGSVQNVFSLKSGGALKVTIEEYLTPKLRKVNQVGIEPDRKVEGSVPQMIAALRLAGMKQFDLTLNKKNVSIGDVEVQDTFEVVRKDGKSFVPSRVLAALLDESVAWNEAARTIEFTANDGTVVYAPAEGEMILKDGASYVDVGTFTEAVPQMTWFDNGQKLVLSTKKP